MCSSRRLFLFTRRAYARLSYVTLLCSSELGLYVVLSQWRGLGTMGKNVNNIKLGDKHSHLLFDLREMED